MAELGSDISGVTDVDSALSVVTGRDALAQAILRRLRTPRGKLWTDRSYGFDLRTIIGTAMTNGQIAQRVSTQVRLEEEVIDCYVEVSRIDDAVEIMIEVTDSEGPFTFTLAATTLSVEIIKGTV